MPYIDWMGKDDVKDHHKSIAYKKSPRPESANIIFLIISIPILKFNFFMLLKKINMLKSLKKLSSKNCYYGF